jgi:amidohydrolase
MPNPTDVRSLLTPKLTSRVTELRRTIHANPELGFQEKETQKLVMSELESYGIRCSKISNTGVQAIVQGKSGKKSKVVMLRADMDALPVTEEADVKWKSRNTGKMHACGHDAHTAMLLGASNILSNNPLDGTVKLCFQPSEETGTGAGVMIDDGILENPRVDAAFGIHVWSGVPTGKFGIMHGNALAAVDEFTIKIEGRGGHAALPHQAVDPIFISSQIISSFQSIISRNLDPVDTGVVTVTGINSPQSYNVIPPWVELKGTVRTFTDEARDLAEKRINEISRGVSKSMGGSVNVVYDRKIPPTVNHSDMADIMWQAAVDILGKKNVFEMKPIMGGEDFGMYLRKVPGCFGFLGMQNKKKETFYPHHHPKFSVDEDCLPYGVAVLYRTAELYFS